VIRLEIAEQRIWAAGEYALRRAREALDAEEGDAGYMVADLRAASEDLAMAAAEIEARLGGRRG